MWKGSYISHPVHFLWLFRILLNKLYIHIFNEKNTNTVRHLTLDTTQSPEFSYLILHHIYTSYNISYITNNGIFACTYNNKKTHLFHCSFPGILPESEKSHGIMLGFSLLTEIPQSFHEIISPIEQNFPQISQMGENVPWNDRWEKIFHFSTNLENLISFG